MKSGLALWDTIVRYLHLTSASYKNTKTESVTPKSISEMKITRNVALEIISHEAIVPEAYKDSVGVWTWGVGVTNASGHQVYPRYKDKPQPLEKCIEVFLWLLETKYAPAVRAAFKKPLTESQFAAALSFHYNTGAIGRADWVKYWNAGSVDAAHDSIMNWSKPAAIIPRRMKEQTLFFRGIWSNDGKVTVLGVNKPSYTPKWSSAQRIDVTEIIDNLLDGSDANS